MTLRTLLQNIPFNLVPEAVLLCDFVLNKPKEFLLAHPELPISKIQEIKYKRLLKQRIAGVPLAYLTGHKEFFGLDFFVNKHVLIPRGETEVLVEKVVEEIKSKIINHPPETNLPLVDKSKIVVIDIGTGSGCIPISIYKTIERQSSIFSRPSRDQSFHFFATDISPQALRVAKKNAKKHSVDIMFLHGNLLEPLKKRFPLLAGEGQPACRTGRGEVPVIITANLPYLTQKQFQVEPSIQHEPISALVAEDHGLALYKKLFHQIQSFGQRPTSLWLAFSNLSAKGRPASGWHSSLSVFLEIDPSQSKTLSEYIKNIFPGANLQILKDLSGNDRVIKIKNLR